MANSHGGGRANESPCPPSPVFPLSRLAGLLARPLCSSPPGLDAAGSRLRERALLFASPCRSVVGLLSLAALVSSVLAPLLPCHSVVWPPRPRSCPALRTDFCGHPSRQGRARCLSVLRTPDGTSLPLAIRPDANPLPASAIAPTATANGGRQLSTQAQNGWDAVLLAHAGSRRCSPPSACLALPTPTPPLLRRLDVEQCRKL